MTQLVHATFADALSEAKDRPSPCVVYWDPELWGFGVYAKEDLTTIGSWVRPDMVVYETKGSPDAFEVPEE